MQKRSWITVISLSALVLSAVVYGLLPRPVQVETAKAFRGPLTVTVEEEGRTNIKDKFIVSAPVAGFMRRISLEVGDPVEKGQIVAELEPLRSAVLDPRSLAAARAAVSQAEAALLAAEADARARAADAAYAKANRDRSRKLYEAGYFTKDALERTESEEKRTEELHASAKAAVQAAHSELARARTALLFAAEGAEAGRTVSLRSPAKGRVLRRHRESEGVVNSGEPLMDVGDPSRLEVKVEVLSADAVRIKPGIRVLFDRWGGEGTLSGKVRIVEPAGFTKISSLGVEEQRTLVTADIISPYSIWRRLGDNYRVEARFIVWEGQDVLQVPAAALFRRGDNWAVFVIEKGRAMLRPVLTGRRSGISVEILSGVAEGEKVIAYPDESIKDSVAVKDAP